MTDDSREDVLKRRKMRRRLHYFTVTGSIILACYAVYTMLFSQWVRIKTVDAQVRDDLNQSIQDKTWAYINDQKPVFVPKTNALFLNRGLLNFTLVNDFPEMRNFQFIYNVPKQIFIVRATPRETSAVLCSLQSVCYAIDEYAIPFKALTGTSTLQYLRIVDGTGNQVSLGKPAMPENFFESLVQYWNAGQDLKLLTNAVIEKESVQAGYIKFETTEGWYVLVKTTLSPRDTFSKIQTVLKTEVKDSTKLQYIDARYTDKVYYK